MRRLAFVLLLACGSDESDVCIFDGRYEMGFIPRNGCGAFSEQIFVNHEQDECYTTEDIIALDGTRRNIGIFCEAGDPVVECEGFAFGSDGCQWDAYMRRVGP